MHDALRELTDIYLVEERQNHFFKPTHEGQQLAVDKTPLWEALCKTTLKPEQEDLVRLVNRPEWRSESGNGGSEDVSSQPRRQAALDVPRPACFLIIPTSALCLL